MIELAEEGKGNNTVKLTKEERIGIVEKAIRAFI